MLPPEKQDLANDLLDRTKECGPKARRYYFIALLIAILSFVASVVTTISVAAEWLPKAVTAVLAAIPAIAVSVAAVFKFEEWRDWWSRRFQKLDSFRRGLLYEGRHESEVSREMTDFLARQEETRPRLGNPVSTRSQDDSDEKSKTKDVRS